MNKKFLKLFVAAIIAFPSFSLAQEQKENNAAKILTLEEVVKSAVKNYPIIFSHYDKIRAAESNLLSAKGFFDIRLKQNYSDRTRGY